MKTYNTARIHSHTICTVVSATGNSKYGTYSELVAFVAGHRDATTHGCIRLIEAENYGDTVALSIAEFWGDVDAVRGHAARNAAIARRVAAESVSI